MRNCFVCGDPIYECMGFILARDLLKIMSGLKIRPREFCGNCDIKAALGDELTRKAFISLGIEQQTYF